MPPLHKENICKKCNNPKATMDKYCTDCSSQPNSEEKKMMYGHTSGSEVQFSHSPKPEEHPLYIKHFNDFAHKVSEPCEKCTPTHTSDEWEKELQKIIRGALKSCIDAHGKIEIPSAEKRLTRPICNFLSTAIKTREEEIVKKWLELDLTNSNKENWSKELSKFGLYMQEIINKLIK